MPIKMWDMHNRTTKAQATFNRKRKIKMPYIDQERRKKLMWVESALEDVGIDMTAGDLQYVIAAAIKHIAPYNYQTMNDVMGALAGAQMEFYRRTVAPYEDQKIEENGDI